MSPCISPVLGVGSVHNLPGTSRNKHSDLQGQTEHMLRQREGVLKPESLLPKNELVTDAATSVNARGRCCSISAEMVQPPDHRSLAARSEPCGDSCEGLGQRNHVDHVPHAHQLAVLREHVLSQPVLQGPQCQHIIHMHPWQAQQDHAQGVPQHVGVGRLDHTLPGERWQLSLRALLLDGCLQRGCQARGSSHIGINPDRQVL